MFPLFLAVSAAEAAAPAAPTSCAPAEVASVGGAVAGAATGDGGWLLTLDAAGTSRVLRVGADLRVTRLEAERLAGARDVAATADGFVVVGHAPGADGDGTIAFLGRYDAGGKLLRHVTITHLATADAVVVDDDGYVVAGADAKRRPGLVRLDRDGAAKWVRLRGSGPPVIDDLAPLPDGFAWTGRTRGDPNQGWLVATNPSGQSLWQFADGDLFPRGLAPASDGVWAVGARNPSGDDGGVAGWVQFFTPDGATRSLEYHDGFADDFLERVAVFPDGSLVVAGHQNRWAEGVPESEPRAWLVRADARGRERWERAWPDAFVGAVFARPDGGTLVAGGLRRGAAADLWLMSLDGDGQPGCR